jgi:hypothetical protein
VAVAASQMQETLVWRIKTMAYRITGLSPEPFLPLYGLDAAALAERGATRRVVDEEPGFPDRIELRDARVGETVLLLNHVSMPLASPYRASHAIFVREGAERAAEFVDEVPEVMRRRLLSLRGFTEDGMMREADVVEGRDADPLIRRMLDDPAIAFIHVHNARQGCYAGLVERA